ncbi:hypothetical protein GCM10027578_10300 [Spirosoma luteolum]
MLGIEPVMVRVLAVTGVAITVPIEIGLVGKAPVASDNCAVNVLPAAKTPVVENGIETDRPAQSDAGEIVPTTIPCASAVPATPRLHSITKSQLERKGFFMGWIYSQNGVATPPPRRHYSI